MNHYRQQANEAINKCLRYARDRYGFDVQVQVVIRNLGQAAGKAEIRQGRFTLIINSQLLKEDAIDYLCNDTIPHEVAHLVCFWEPSLGRDHDRGWKRVCVSLGGSGKRCHNLKVQKVRRTKKAIYDINGQEVKVGITRHKRIQNRTHVYRFVACNSPITPDLFTGRIVLD